MKEFKGIMPPLVTAFNADESFNKKAMQDHVDWIISNGVHGISPAGSTGEFISMEIDEHKTVIETVVEHANGRVQVYAGTGSYSTKKTIELSKFAESEGADGVLVINPYYIQPSTADVLNHFRTLREAISIPIMLYQNPHVCGYQLPTEDVAVLVNEGVIQSAKIANGPASEVVKLKQLCGDSVQAIYGADPEAAEALLMGADGWITSFINVAPALCRRLYDAAVAKNVDEVRDVWSIILPFFNFAYSGKTHWLQVVKSALSIMGKNVGSPRKPISILEGDMRAELESIMRKMGLVE